MTQDQSKIALDNCTRIVTAATALLDSLDALEVAAEQLTGAGIDLTAYTAAIEAAPGTAHCKPTTYKNLLVMAPGIVAAMKALYDGSPTQQCWQAFQEARH